MIEEVSEQGWLSRIGGSIKGILTGLLFFFIAIPVVFYNECSAVDRADDLEVGLGAVVKATPADLDSDNEGKLVHVTGIVAVSETLTDDTFKVSSKALELKRVVEMYQWKENTTKDTKKKAGGKTVTKTTYTYEEAWSDTVNNSSEFKEKGHDNPDSMPFEEKAYAAQAATLGAYKLAPGVSSRVGSLSDLELSKSDISGLPKSHKLKLHDGKLYRAKKPTAPKNGDVRISYKVREPGKASVVAGQYGGILKAYSHESLNDPLVLVVDDEKSPEQMFEAAESTNAMFAWIFRLVTFLMMFGGISMVLKPLSVIADVIPFIGNLVSTGTTMIAFLIATPIWFFCVASAWVVARPLLGIGLILVGVVVTVLLVMSALKSGAKKVVSAVKPS